VFKLLVDYIQTPSSVNAADLPPQSTMSHFQPDNLEPRIVLGLDYGTTNTGRLDTLPSEQYDFLTSGIQHWHGHKLRVM
jgi:hypothetical protein